MDQPTQNMQPEQPKSSNTGKIIGGVIALLVILGIAGFLISKKEATEVKSGSESAGQMQTEQTAAQPMSLKDLMTGGKTQKCIFSSSSDSGSNQGSVYMADGKMRADVNTTVNGKAMGGHMINDGKYIYSWSDEQKMGAKMSITAMTQMQTNNQMPTGQAQARSSVDENAKYAYNCSNWSADQTQFTPPTDVNFIDPSQMMNQIKAPSQAPGSMSAGASAASGANPSACAACAQAGANKAACLAALHCQ